MKKSKNQYIPAKILYEDTIGDFYFDDSKSENKKYFLRGLIRMSALLIVAVSLTKFI
jgi:hypothetical protein